MQYYALSFSYKKTPIVLREQIAILQNEFLAFGRAIKDEDLEEVVIVSTCNRTEFYCYTKNPASTKQKILSTLCAQKSLSLELLEESAESYQDIEAIHHLFCVASGLDSIVIGETQIVGQIKDAYRSFYEAGLCAKALTRLVHFAFRCAAKVRTHTEIAKNATSVASVAAREAVALGEGNHLEKRALIIGFGDIGRLCAKYLLGHGYEVMICNRSQEGVWNFLEKNPEQKEKIKFHPLQDLSDIINDFPFVFSATASPQTIIQKEMIIPSPKKRFFFDLALPRDIQTFVLENVKIYVIDDFDAIVRQNLASKKEGMYKAFEIVGIATMEFQKWLQNLDVEPLIKEIRQLAKQAAFKEIKKAIKKRYITPEQQYTIEKILHQAFNTFLHTPTQNLRESVHSQESDIILESVKSFFGICEEKMLLNTYKCEYDTATK